MVKKISILIGAVITIGLCVELIYANLRLRLEVTSGQNLAGRLTQLQVETEKMSSALKEKEAQLNALRDVRAIRLALTSAQTNVNQLNAQLAQVAGEKAALQQTNFSLSSRLDNTTKELVSTLDELKRSRTQIINLNHTPAQVNEFENKVKELEAERDRLKTQLAAITGAADRSGTPIKSLQDTIARLSKELAQKNEQARALEEESKQLRVGGSDVRLREQEQTIQQLQAENQRLSADIARLRSLRESSAQEASDAQAQIDALQARIATLSRNKIDNSAVFDLKQQLTEAQDALAEKTAQVETLQKTLGATKQKLASREEEQKAVEEKITQLESMAASLQDELKAKKSVFDENDALYVSMRQQVTQLSNVLAKKEIELENKVKEFAALSEQSAGLKVRIARLESELTGAKDRQKKTLDDLYQAVKLNTALQERMLGASQSLSGLGGVPDQQKADQLKRKIEVILEPDKSQ
jgi:chromosome segregation ATPase